MSDAAALSITKAREEFADLVNRAVYADTRTVLTKQGKEAAAVVPIKDLRLLEKLDKILDIAAAQDALAEGAPRTDWDTLKQELALGD